MKNKKLFNMCAAAMFTAIIFVMTRFISVPVASGYVHFGDALVYIAASVLGGPWAFFAASAGEALADISFGMAYYAPATLIVKALIAIPFVVTHKNSERILTPVTALMTVVSGIITVSGYYISDLIIDRSYAVVNMPGNVIQAVGSAVIFIVISAAFDAAGIKKKLFLKREV